MNRNLLLTEKVVQSRVRVERTKTIQFAHILNGQIARFFLVAIFVERRKLQRIVFALQTPGIEQVIGFLDL